MQHRSAEVIAVNNFLRYIFCAAGSAYVLPMIARPSTTCRFAPFSRFHMQEAIGAGWTNTFSALLVWVGFGLILFLRRYGDQLRAWKAPVDECESGIDSSAASQTTAVEEKKKEKTEV